MANEYSSFKVTGFNEVLSKLSDLPREMYLDLIPVLKEGLRKLHQQVVSNVPVKTGKLRGSIKIEDTQALENWSNVYGKIYTNVPYAHLVEYGFIQTGHKPNKVFIGVNSGQAFLRPALYANENEIVKDTASKTNKIVEKFNKKL